MKTNAIAIRRLADLSGEKIISVRWDDPQLVVKGRDWSIAAVAPWRVLKDRALILGSDEAVQEDLEKILVGNAIKTCTFQSAHADVDPALAFESGHLLEIFSSSALEPWLFCDANGSFLVADPTV